MWDAPQLRSSHFAAALYAATATGASVPSDWCDEVLSCAGSRLGGASPRYAGCEESFFMHCLLQVAPFAWSHDMCGPVGA
jgi:hypothetical protein